MSAKLTDAKAAKVRRLAFYAIQAVAFLEHHADSDEVTEALDVLQQARLNLDQIEQLLAKAEKRTEVKP